MFALIKHEQNKTKYFHNHPHIWKQNIHTINTRHIRTRVVNSHTIHGHPLPTIIVYYQNTRAYKQYIIASETRRSNTRVIHNNKFGIDNNKTAISVLNLDTARENKQP